MKSTKLSFDKKDGRRGFHIFYLNIVLYAIRENVRFIEKEKLHCLYSYCIDLFFNVIKLGI